MRKTLIVALAALVALAVSAVAIAQTPGAELTSSVSPSKAGTKKKPKATKVTVEIDNADATQTADQLKIYLPKQLRASGKGIAKCSLTTLEALDPAKCSKASRLGAGTADAVAGVNTAAPNTLKFVVDAFMHTNKKIGFMIRQDIENYEGINVVAIGTLKNASGKYGTVLDVPLPDRAREYPDGNFNGLDRLKVSLYKKKGKNALFKLNGCPSNRTVPFKLTIGFMPNPNPPKAETVTALAGADCRKN